MANVKEMRIFCAEQIEVPSELPNILKKYSKAVIKENPSDIIDFSRKYFEDLLEQRNKNLDDQELKLNTVEKR